MGYRDYSTVIGRIVDPNGKGDFTTIQSAIDAASADETIYIRPGTYTENLTLKADVNLTASQGTITNDAVLIIGKLSASFAGSVAISNLTFQTNSDYCLEQTGASACVVSFVNCKFTGSDNTVFNVTNTNSSSLLSLDSSSVDLTTTGITTFTFTGSGGLSTSNTAFANTADSTTRSTISSGSWNNGGGVSLVPITISGTAGATINGFRMQTPVGTTEMIVTDTSIDVNNCFFGSTTQNVAVLTINGSAIARVFDFRVFSTATNVIDGTGVLGAGNIAFYSSSGISTTTVNTFARYPYSTSFGAYQSGNVSNVTGNGTGYTVIFDTEEYDTNSAYDNTTGVFTVPFGGIYEIGATVLMASPASGYTQALLFISASTGGNRRIVSLAPNNVLSGGTLTLSGSAQIILSKGETVSITFQVTGGVQDVGIFGGKDLTFVWGSRQA